MPGSEVTVIAMGELRLVARTRTGRLTDRETVRLGRIVHKSVQRNTAFPEDTPTVVVVVRDFTGMLSADAASKIQEVIGEFDQVTEAG